MKITYEQLQQIAKAHNISVDELLRNSKSVQLPSEISIENHKPVTKSKYKNVRTKIRGITYDSKMEAVRAEQLLDMLDRGLIYHILVHPRYMLGLPENVYEADFCVFGLDEIWVEDVKGAETQKFRKDVALWREYGPPLPLRVIKHGKIAYTVFSKSSERMQWKPVERNHA